MSFLSSKMQLELHGMFEHNDTFDYSDYEYKDDCITKRSSVAIFIPILYIVALILGLMGNVLVLVVLWKKRRNWRPMDAFVLHLSIADLLLVFTMPLWAADALKGWRSGTGVCKLAGSIFKVNKLSNFLSHVNRWLVNIQYVLSKHYHLLN